MTPRKKLPTRSMLRLIFRYDGDTGTLYWKGRFGRSRVRSDRVGTPRQKGVVRVTVFGVAYAAHRLIWKLLHNTEPLVVDHKNCTQSDNRQCNLRAATYPKNNWNRRVRIGKVLPKWVMFDGNPPGRRKKYKAVVVVNGVAHHPGRFYTPEEAHAAACAVARNFHGHFFRSE